MASRVPPHSSLQEVVNSVSFMLLTFEAVTTRMPEDIQEPLKTAQIERCIRRAQHYYGARLRQEWNMTEGVQESLYIETIHDRLKALDWSNPSARRGLLEWIKNHFPVHCVHWMEYYNGDTEPPNANYFFEGNVSEEQKEAQRILLAKQHNRQARPPRKNL